MVVVYVLGSGCAAGPLASFRAAPPAERQSPGHFRADGGSESFTSVVALPLTGSEIDILWGELAGESPWLADQSASVDGEYAGWFWCGRCQSNQPEGHTCSGSGSGGGGGSEWGEELTLKQAVFLVVVCGVVLVGGLAAMMNQ